MNMTFFFHEKNKINVSAFTFTITTIPSILTLQNKGGLHSMKCSSEIYFIHKISSPPSFMNIDQSKVA